MIASIMLPDSETTIGQLFEVFFTKKQFKPTLILLYATVAMVCWKYLFIPEPLQQFYFQIFGKSVVSQFFLGTYKIFGSFFLFGIIPILIIKLVFREKAGDYGLRPGNTKRVAFTFGVLAPVMIVLGFVAGRDPAFWSVYPFNRTVTTETTLFACHALTYLAYYFGWEFFFRGFLQHGLRESFGGLNAVLVQTMASTLLHLGNPVGEVFGAIFGGLLWGGLTVYCRSIFSGFLQHSLLGITLDWFILKNSVVCQIIFNGNPS
ncbi:MAG: CPBP family intramembrane metalloprotease [Planctomycetaceae bacterium]|nr:CPBP family intramembrane metalloprotease [Planctomycetaceae bacterium]